MAWSARRDGMILEVAEVPDAVAIYINERADREGKSVDAVACELLATAMNPQAVRALACSVRPTLPSHVYGVINQGGRFSVVVTEVQNVTEKSVIVKKPMPMFAKRISKLRYDGRPEAIGFTPAEAVQRQLDLQRDLLERARTREVNGELWTAERVAQGIRYCEQCVASLERLLEQVGNPPPSPLN